MAALPNPFTLGTSAMPHRFAGRSLLLQEVMDLAEPLYFSPQERNRAPNRDIILWGPEGIGKTALLRAIERRLEERKEQFKKDASKEDKDTEHTVLRWTPQSCRTREVAARAISPAGILQSVADAQKTFKAPGVLIKFNDPPSPTIHSALESRLASGPLVVLLDDAQEVKPVIVRELLDASQLLRSDGRPLLLVLAGTARLVTKLDKVSRALLRRNTFIPLGPLDEESARQALAGPLKKVNADPRELGILLAEAQGHPQRLQELGALVIQQLNDRETKTVTAAVAHEVVTTFQGKAGKQDETIRNALDGDVSVSKEHEDRVKQLEAEMEDLRARRDKLNAKKKRLDKRHRKLKADGARIETQGEDLDSQKELLKVRHDELDSEKERLEERYRELDSEKKRLEERHRELDLEKTRLEGRRGELNLEKIRWEGQHSDLDAEKRRLEARHEEVDADRKRLEERQKEMDRESDRQANRRGKLDLEEKDQKDRQAQVDLEQKRLEEERQKLRSEKKSLEGRREELDSATGRLEERRTEMNGEKKRLEERSAEMDAEKERLDERNEKMQAEQERLDEMKAAMDVEKESLDERSKEMEAEVEAQRKDMETQKRRLSEFLERKKQLHPRKWRWIFGDEQLPGMSIE